MLEPCLESDLIEMFASWKSHAFIGRYGVEYDQDFLALLNYIIHWWHPK